MDDREALLRAAVASPDDDLPRLVYADWLEEHDDPGQAAFVRAQCELAATPAWEPFAVRCRAKRPEWVTGRPWRYALPAVDGRLLEWHPESGFRRGLGWGLVVRQLGAFLDAAPRLFDLAPVGELHLPTATLDEWKRFARQPWLPRVRAVHFYGTTTPIEPVGVLRDSPLATGIEGMVFERSSSPAMPILLRELLASPVGRRLRRLELRIGPDDPDAGDELLVAVADAEDVRLDAFRLVTVSQRDGLNLLQQSPVLGGLADLDVANVLGAWLPTSGGPRTLTRLRTVRCGVGAWTASSLTRPGEAETVTGVRSVDLSDNLIEQWYGPGPRSDAGLGGLPNLRALNLRRTRLGAGSVYYWLTRAGFWSNLVELDVRDNDLGDVGAKHLLEAPVPPDLTALWLGGNQVSDAAARRLRDHFGDALSFDVGEVGPGLR